MHKISQAARDEGLQPARQLLQDWLVRALAKYNLNRMNGRQNIDEAGSEAVQVSNATPFDACMCRTQR